MRIRNRKVPFPLSSLSPVPLSDPVVQLQHSRYEEDDTDDYFDPKPSDQYSKEPIRAVDGGAQLEKVSGLLIIKFIVFVYKYYLGCHV